MRDRHAGMRTRLSGQCDSGLRASQRPLAFVRTWLSVAVLLTIGCDSSDRSAGIVEGPARSAQSVASQERARATAKTAQTGQTGQTGLAGSSTIERRAMIMGQVAIGGHLTIGEGAFLGGRAGVAEDVAPGAEIWGTPGMEGRSWFRSMAWVARLPELVKRLRAVEKKVGL